MHETDMIVFSHAGERTFRRALSIRQTPTGRPRPEPEAMVDVAAGESS
jgi:hypothetical protein